MFGKKKVTKSHPILNQYPSGTIFLINGREVPHFTISNLRRVYAVGDTEGYDKVRHAPYAGFVIHTTPNKYEVRFYNFYQEPKELIRKLKKEELLNYLYLNKGINLK